MLFHSQNPATEEVLAKFETESSSNFIEKLKGLSSRYLSWRVDLSDRMSLLQKVELKIHQNREALANSMSLEMGKIYRESLVEIDKSLSSMKFFRENAVKFLEDEKVQTEMKDSYVSFQPLGVIFGIMPWNFPVWQAIRFAVPTLLSGNVVLLKPAPNVCLTTQILAECFSDLQGAFEWIRADESLCKEILAHPQVAALSFTGSAKTGSYLAQLAGASLKKSVLELGGTDAALILEDADLELALNSCIRSRFGNAGQACIAAKRWILTESNFDEFISKLEVRLKRLRYGDPFDDQVDFGPLARKDLRDQVHSQVMSLRSLGYEIRMGGEMPNGVGYFYPATLIIRSHQNLPSFKEEIFGPVIVLETVKSNRAAIKRANDSTFGLGASVFSRDTETVAGIARALEVGTVTVNGIVRSDPRLPFGGTKNSGWGRELGRWGFREFTNIQSVMVDQ